MKRAETSREPKAASIKLVEIRNAEQLEISYEGALGATGA
jgi:hypothetical protein